VTRYRLSLGLPYEGSPFVEAVHTWVHGVLVSVQRVLRKLAEAHAQEQAQAQRAQEAETLSGPPKKQRGGL
jgi:hypothetical protein